MTEPAGDAGGAAPARPGRRRDVVIRAVLDTNVPVAAHLARNPRSPTLELIDRWRAGEFAQLYSDDLLAELVGTLLARGIAAAVVDRYVADLIILGEHVAVTPEQTPAIIAEDPDDDAVLACAFIGRATHIVTHDPHFAVLGGSYQGIPILDGLSFLYKVRGDR